MNFFLRHFGSATEGQQPLNIVTATFLDQYVYILSEGEKPKRSGASRLSSSVQLAAFVVGILVFWVYGVLVWSIVCRDSNEFVVTDATGKQKI